MTQVDSKFRVFGAIFLLIIDQCSLDRPNYFRVKKIDFENTYVRGLHARFTSLFQIFSGY